MVVNIFFQTFNYIPKYNEIRLRAVVVVIVW